MGSVRANYKAYPLDATTFSTWSEAMKPPVPPRAVSPEDVPRIDAMITLGITQRAVARQLDIHWRTVSNIWHRRGAYAGVPK